MEKNKAFGYLGLAARSGRAPSGEFQTETALKNGTARVVILAVDASDNTKKHFQNMCEFRNVPCVEIGTRDELGHRIGREFRSSAAITDPGLAEAFLKAMRQESQRR